MPAFLRSTPPADLLRGHIRAARHNRRTRRARERVHLMRTMEQLGESLEAAHQDIRIMEDQASLPEAELVKWVREQGYCCFCAEGIDTLCGAVVFACGHVVHSMCLQAAEGTAFMAEETARAAHQLGITPGMSRMGAGRDCGLCGRAIDKYATRIMAPSFTMGEYERFRPARTEKALRSQLKWTEYARDEWTRFHAKVKQIMEGTYEDHLGPPPVPICPVM